MKLLLHACCADCTLKFIESIKNDKEVTDLAVYYYNPNIQPRAEYQARLKAIQQICEENKIKLIVADWRPVEYFKEVKISTKPARCINCWNLRLSKTAEYAAKNDYDAFTSTLITSEYQDSEMIKKIAEDKTKGTKLNIYIPKEICTDLKTSGFYKQFFCGCVYSLTERMEEKFK